MILVSQLAIDDLAISEIKDFKKIADHGDEVFAETGKAFRIEYSFTRKEIWIPKSQARLGHNKSLWVKNWFYDRELSP